MIFRALCALALLFPLSALAAPIGAPPGLVGVMDEGSVEGRGLGFVNFIGAGVDCDPSPENNRIDCTFVGGEGGGASNVTVDGGSVIGTADFVDGAQIEFAESSGEVTASIVAGSIGTTELDDGAVTIAKLEEADYGDFTNSGGVFTLDAGVVDADALASTTVTPASYGSASKTVSFTVDADGRLTAASATDLDAGNVAVNLSPLLSSATVAQGLVEVYNERMGRFEANDCTSTPAGSIKGDICVDNQDNQNWRYNSTTQVYYPVYGFSAFADDTIAALQPVYLVGEGPTSKEWVPSVAPAEADDSTWLTKPAVGIALNAANAGEAVRVATTGFVIEGIDTDETGSVEGEPVCVGNSGGFAWGNAGCAATFTKQRIGVIMTKDGSSGRIWVAVGSTGAGGGGGGGGVQHSHATDCTAVTGAFQGEVCLELDDGSLHVCLDSPTCEDPEDWQVVAGTVLDVADGVVRPKRSTDCIGVGTDDSDFTVCPGEPISAPFGIVVPSDVPNRRSITLRSSGVEYGDTDFCIAPHLNEAATPNTAANRALVSIPLYQDTATTLVKAECHTFGQSNLGAGEEYHLKVFGCAEHDDEIGDCDELETILDWDGDEASDDDKIQASSFGDAGDTWAAGTYSKLMVCFAAADTADSATDATLHFACDIDLEN